MKILYGIQGTGNGHITRSTRIIQCLQERGIKVDAIFSGCDKNKIYDTSIIHAKGFFKGFTFSVKNGSIQYINTAKNLSIGRFIKDLYAFDASGYDLVITDFDPVSAFVAKKNKIPSLGLGHQYAFLHDIPMDRSNYPARLIIRNFAPAEFSIGMHWHHFDCPIVPPVIPRNLYLPEKTHPDLILVYLPFENHDHIRQLLRPFKDYRFAVYAGNSDYPKTCDDNIIWHPFSKTRFHKDLTLCQGVICNAGFELPSEAMSLGKKLLVKPLKRQFEQISNAMTINLLKLGTAVDTLDYHHIKKFLDTDMAYQHTYPDTAMHIADWILAGNLDNPRDLINTVWQSSAPPDKAYNTGT